MAAPVLEGAGGFAGSAGTASPSIPAGTVAGDILILAVETENETVTLSTPNGFALVATPTGTGTAGATTASRITLFWKRAVGGDAAPTVADAGDHVACRIFRISGCIETGNPWNGTPTWSVDATADTGHSAPGPTTTVDECLVMIFAANVQDTNTAQTVDYANANLTGLAGSGFGDNTNQGSGGGFNVGVGVKDTAGAVGNTTLTYGQAGQKSVCVIALMPPTPPTPKAGTDTDGTHTETASITVQVAGAESLGTGPVLSVGPVDSSPVNVDVAEAFFTWINPGQAQDVDGFYADVSAFETGGISDYLYMPLGGSLSAIPDTATIVGFLLETWELASWDNQMPSLIFALTKDGFTEAGTKSSDMAGGSAIPYGGSSDLWGTTWTVAEVKDPDFGVFAQCFHTNSQFESSYVAIDHMRLTVYYREATLPFTAESASKTQDGGEEKSGADTDGTHTESADPVAALPGADTDGTHTESGSPDAALGGLDTDGSGNEDGSLAGQLPGTDADGTHTEDAAALYGIPGTDTDGANTETGAVGQAVIDDTDLGASAVQTGAVGATMSGSDSDGAETETGTITSPVSAADNDGAELESAEVAAPKQGDDANSQFAGAEEGLTLVSLAGDDADGTHIESASPALTGQDSDGTAAESGSIDTEQSVQGNDADGTPTEDATLASVLASSDAMAAAAELALLQLYGVDLSGAPAETILAAASLAGLDLSAAVDSGSANTGGAGTPAVRQSKSGNGNPAVVSLDLAPVSGNKLIVIAFNRTATTSFTISGTGWNQRVMRHTEKADSNARRSIMAWEKTAGASEPSSIQVSGDITTVVVIELEGSPSWTWLDKGENDNGTTLNATSLSTGATPALTGRKALIGAVGMRLNNAGSPSGEAWTEGLTQIHRVDEGGFLRYMNVALLAVDETDGAESSTWSTDAVANSGISGLILAFGVPTGEPEPKSASDATSGTSETGSPAAALDAAETGAATDASETTAAMDAADQAAAPTETTDSIVASSGTDTSSAVDSGDKTEPVIGEFPTTGLLDDLLRANETPIGPPWVNSVYSGDGPVDLISNALQRPGVGWGSVYYDQVFGPDMENWFEVKAADGSDGLEVAVRVTNGDTSTPNGYFLHIAGAGGTWQFWKITAGGQSVVGASVDPAFTIAAGDMIGVDVKGAVLRAFHKPAGGSWSEVLSRTDGSSPHLGGGALGYLIQSSNWRIGPINGGTIVAGGGTLKSGSDIGASTDQSSLAVAGAGSDVGGTPSEATVLSATILGDESGAGADTAVLATVMIFADDTDGTASEVGQVSGMVVTIQGNDAASGQDTAGALRAIAVLDLSGSPVELGQALISMAGADAAAALEGALMTAQIAGQDVKVAIELATLLSLVASADASQAVIEEARTALTGQDTSAGAETGAAIVSLQGQETAVAGETADLSVMLPAVDVGLSVEAALVLIRGLLQAIATGKIVSEVPSGRFGQGSSGRVRS